MHRYQYIIIEYISGVHIQNMDKYTITDHTQKLEKS